MKNGAFGRVWLELQAMRSDWVWFLTPVMPYHL